MYRGNFNCKAIYFENVTYAYVSIEGLKTYIPETFTHIARVNFDETDVSKKILAFTLNKYFNSDNSAIMHSFFKREASNAYFVGYLKQELGSINPYN